MALPVVRLSKSVVGQKEIEAVTRVLTRGFLGMGSEVQAFENELVQYIGGERKVVCVNTGTAALHLACQALGFGPGDEVLVPTLTYVASFQAVSATGAKPIACDIEEATGLLDLEDAQRRITPRTKGLMYVHYASYPGNLDRVYSFARSNNLRVVEDAAHSFGCTYSGHRIGSFGDVVCFSFDGIKNITCGEGGAVVTGDELVAQKVQDARLLGVEKDTQKRFAGERSWEFEVSQQGWRYHMSDIMAAIGRTQLARFETEFRPKRMALARRYRDQLEKDPKISFFKTEPSAVVPHIMPILIAPKKRTQVKQALQEVNIQTGIHYKPNHLLQLFSANSNSFPNANHIYDQILTLPLHPEIDVEQVDRIVEIVRSNS